MRGARLPRQACAFSGGPKECSAPFAEDCFGETRNPQGGCHAGVPADSSSSVGWQAEAEHAQSAGRRLRPEAVSGRCTERGIGDKGLDGKHHRKSHVRRAAPGMASGYAIDMRGDARLLDRVLAAAVQHRLRANASSVIQIRGDNTGRTANALAVAPDHATSQLHADAVECCGSVAFSKRVRVGCETRSLLVDGSRPTSILCRVGFVPRRIVGVRP